MFIEGVLTQIMCSRNAITFQLILFNLYIRYKMSSESSFDAQVFNEFDDFVPKPHSTDSDCIPSNPESPHAAISSQGPPPPITILPSSQTSIPPATPGISESFCKLDIAPQDTNSLPNRRRRGCPFKRIYARRHTLGKTIAREDALVKPADYITKMSKPRQGRTVGGGGAARPGRHF